MNKNMKTWSYVGTISGIITLIGCFLPFMGSSGIFQPTKMYSVVETIAAVGLDGITNGSGVIILLPLFAGVLSIIFNIAMLKYAALVASIICAIPWLFFSVAIVSNLNFSYVGVGFWVMTIGMILSLIAPISAIRQGKRA